MENQRDDGVRISQLNISSFEDGGIELYAKEWRQPVETRRGEETDFRLESPEGMQPFGSISDF